MDKHQKEALVSFGQRLAQLRKERGWSQERLALESGLSRSYLGGVERGSRNISLDNIRQLARTLKITISEITDFSATPIKKGAGDEMGQLLNKIKKSASYIPALPGYSTVELMGYEDDEGKCEYRPYLRPIIGWEVAKDKSAHRDDENIVYVKPVTVEGVDEDNAIVYPDGRVELPYMYYYDTVDEWKEAELDYKKQAAEKDRESSSAPSAPSAPAPDNLG